MQKSVIKKGLVCGLLVLVMSLSISAAAVDITTYNAQKEVLGTTLDPSNLLGQQAWQQLQQVMVNETNGYLMYTSSGSGSSVHAFVKIPHLRNSKGFCLGGFIIYTGLTALTMVWRIANGSATDVVDSRIGPHVVMFTGVGYSFFNHNMKGGSGRVIAVSLKQPSVLP